MTYTVTAANGSTADYVVTVTIGDPSSDADLSHLTLSAGSLTPKFIAYGTDYAATVSNATSSVTVTPTTSHAHASVVVNGQLVHSGAASQVIPLAVGTNMITIIVTAEDGITTQTYTVMVTRQAASGSGSSGSSSPTHTTTTEIITVDVTAGDKGGVYKTIIERTTNSDGTKSDHVTLLPEKAKEAIDKTKAAGADTVRILIPDTKNEVKEVRVDLPSQAIRTIADSGLALQIDTDNGIITIPNGSLQDMNSDLYFHIVPIKQETERKQVEERAKKEQVVREALGDGSVKIVGRPMTIETNMSSHKVQITLPIDRSLLPQDAKDKETFLENLVIFIEHSDGEKALVRSVLGDYPDGRLGLTFTIEKFSTFTILNMDNWSKYIAAGQTDANGSHKAYINGYPDHTFKPANSLTRAEIAAILSRILEAPQAKADISYPDVSQKHWANDVIAQASQTGLMKGYPDGSFNPDGVITRAEMAAILARWMQLNGTPDQSFTDVQGHWAEQVIAQVNQAGYMTGYPNGSFQPDKALTRAEAVAIINRVIKRGPLYGTTFKSWSDVADDHWALNEIEEASLDHRYVARPEGGEEQTK
ncbi:S-layer homology domain-containing protein [Paenibacillus sp. D2_2]|uniref:S-layer homology domain-containing protein n=1 Tax=Paenibacillus sp. D2_2 TaxID=3073092 RepID=UPI002814F1B8|nr:S-layer homology domain-containing protein [Paenibacillus sp. D2_2]WMT40994.1 S-layer homology domain-containing protein [Paenibacillus sp. D2_2]